MERKSRAQLNTATAAFHASSDETEKEALRSLTYELSNVWFRLSEHVKAHVERAKQNVTDKIWALKRGVAVAERNITWQQAVLRESVAAAKRDKTDKQRLLKQNETDYAEKKDDFEYANVSYQMAVSNYNRANHMSEWINVVNEKPATGAMEDFRQFIQRTMGAGELYNKSHEHNRSHDGIDQAQVAGLVRARTMPQFDVVEAEEGTVLHFEQALKAESVSLAKAHAEAQKVEEYLLGMKQRVHESIQNMTRDIYTDTKTLVDDNVRTLHNVHVALKNRTVENSLAQIVQAGVDIVYLQQQLARVLRESDTNHHGTTTVKQLADNPLALVEERVGSTAEEKPPFPPNFPPEFPPEFPQSLRQFLP